MVIAIERCVNMVNCINTQKLPVVKTEELNKWIHKVRTKKIIKKRTSHGTNLRVMAVLTQAQRCAEQILRQKQEERAQKWAKVKTHLCHNDVDAQKRISDEEMDLQRRQIDDLWANELSGLNNFMKSLHQVRVN